MSKELDLLKYENCIANLPNSVLRKYGVATVGKTLPLADRYLEKDPKNVVILLLDGLGTNILQANCKEDGFLRKHFIDSYSTVFPPTTVAATTSAMSGLQPIEHTWLGWDCYYPQVDKNVTVFLNTEQGTNRPVSDENIPRKYCGYESFTEKLTKAGKNAHMVMPFAPPFPGSFDAVCGEIEKLCAGEEETIIYAYWDEPDSTMHEYGCYSKEAKEVIAQLEQQIEGMCSKLTDTLLIITADHGHIDGRNVSITDYPKIMECLVRLPSIEPRALNLFVKDQMREQFEAEFMKEFGRDFLLLTKEEVYRKKLFGTGIPHENVDAMIGDYVAIGITDLTIFNTGEEAEELKGVHAGHTREEMTIPFIVFERTGHEVPRFS